MLVWPAGGGRMEARLIVGGKSVTAAVVGENALGTLSADRVRILRALSGEAKYPAQLARELKLQVQTVYYHVRMLAQEGLVKLVEREEKGGATAKKFACAADAFAVVVNDKAWKAFASGGRSTPPTFLKGFFSDGYFDGKFVLGSPDPHGKYRARGSELCAVEIAMLLGRFGAFDYPLYYLDTELRGEARRNNLVAIGGPKVNSFVGEINSSLPIYFEEKTFTIRSKLSGKAYEENVGVIELVENPFNKSKRVLLVAGTNQSSTRVAVLALLKERAKLEKGNHFDSSSFASVVQGFDEDGDGIVDAVEILE